MGQQERHPIGNQSLPPIWRGMTPTAPQQHPLHQWTALDPCCVPSSCLAPLACLTDRRPSKSIIPGEPLWRELDPIGMGNRKGSIPTSQSLFDSNRCRVFIEVLVGTALGLTLTGWATERRLGSNSGFPLPNPPPTSPDCTPFQPSWLFQIWAKIVPTQNTPRKMGQRFAKVERWSLTKVCLHFGNVLPLAGQTAR